MCHRKGPGIFPDRNVKAAQLLGHGLKAPRFLDALLGSSGSKADAISGTKLTDAFKRVAVAQVADRGYPVREVAERLVVSTESIYTWQ
ncbi:transposase [Paracoccus sp. (in: a-proteobacteria)]|uniref:transposase n=1 Tax=Paracoccus sp. TaxID=267 RepID=UPI003917082A